MTLTLVQKLRVSVVSLVINAVWAVDRMAQILNGSLLLKLVFNLTVISIFAYFMVYPVLTGGMISASSRSISFLHTGIVDAIYGQPLAINPGQFRSATVAGMAAQSPILENKTAFPFVTANAHLIVDNASGKVLSEHNVHLPFAPASTTKLMTALVALDLYSTEDELSISDECAEIESTKLWLPSGKAFLMRDLLAGLLISSAADAGCAFATEKVSGEEFVELMNSKAHELGMENSHFTNTIGLDGEGGSHYASAWDLYLLSEAAMRHGIVRDLVKQTDYSFSSIDEELEVELQSTNRLLWEIPETIGIKTGTTEGAGEVLIYRYADGPTDLTVIVMASSDRFSDTKKLLEWVLNSYSWY